MTIGAAQQFFLGASKATGGGAAGYQVERSLRFNSSDSGFCSRTPAVAGNRRTWTWSGWVKRSALSSGTHQAFFGLVFGSNDASQINIHFDTTDNLRFNLWSDVVLRTTQVFRDCSAWYHVVIAFDATQGTASNRLRIYVNGTEITTFSTNNRSSLLSNQDYAVNAAQAHYIGYNNVASEYFNGYLAEVFFIDGQQLTPSSFTEVSATTGQLIPKAYSGSFGTNGFWLKFSDNSAATAATLGKDYSGNSNNWTPNNLSVTAGAGNDSLVDTPTSFGTDTGVGNEVRGNYCTFNPLKMSLNAPSLTNGNLDLAFGSGTSTWRNVAGTFGLTSGKWYWEVTATVVGGSGQIVGIASAAYNFNKDTGGGGDYIGIDANSWGYYSNNGQIFTSNAGTAYGSTYATGDVIGVALDLDNGKVWFSKNGTYQNSGSPTGGTNAAATGLPVTGIFPAFSVHGSGGSTQTVNFGQRTFSYAAPANFRPLVDTLLPTPVVAKPNTLMDVVTYTGNSTNRNITGLAFSPDLVWTKCRSSALDNKLQDIVRGATAGLISNSTGAETTDTNGVLSFNSDGYSLGIGNVYNGSGDTYVAWCWDAGTSTVSNTQGSITSQVRANVSAGFSVVTATKTSGTHTVGHGLGVTPSLIIVKNRAATSDWIVAHSALNMSTQLVYLNKTDSVYTETPLWGGAPTSSVFYVAGTMLASNDFVAYCFAPVVGYSNFGSYVGNGSSDGPFVYTGFRPRWILLKESSASGNNWFIYDTARNTFNVCQSALRANLSAAELTTSNINFDILSNGFKPRNSDSFCNGSGSTYIYYAVAENPFQYARAR